MYYVCYVLLQVELDKPIRINRDNPAAAAIFLVLLLTAYVANLWYPIVLRLSQVSVTSVSSVNIESPQSYEKPIKPDYAIPPITDGLAPVLNTIPTQQPVVFLGIDDGANKEISELRLLQANRVKATLFLSELFISEDPGFFTRFMKAGYPIENHSVSHELLSDMTYEQQKQEICGEADIQERQFGRRPVLFRPPGGDYNVDTQRAAADCGMKAIVNWIAKANGGSMQYQIGDHLNSGDIVLMHFRPEFAEDLRAFVEAQKAAGLRTVLLEDWLAK